MKLFFIFIVMVTNLFSLSLSTIINEKLEKSPTIKKNFLVYQQKRTSLQVAQKNHCAILDLDRKQLGRVDSKNLLLETIKNYKMQAVLAANSYMVSADKVIFEIKNSYIHLLTEKNILNSCTENQKDAKKIYLNSKKEYQKKAISLERLKDAKSNFSISNTNLANQKITVENLVKKYKKSMNKKINIKTIESIDSSYRLPQKYKDIYRFLHTEDIKSLGDCKETNVSENRLNEGVYGLTDENNESNTTQLSYLHDDENEHSGLYALFSAVSLLFGSAFLFGFYRKKGYITDDYVAQAKSKIKKEFSFLNRLSYEKELELALVHNKKNHLLFDISHELSIPLRKIVHQLNNLKNSLITPKDKEMAEKLQYKVTKLEDMIEDIVHRSQLYEEEGDIENVNFDIYNKIEFVVETYASRADNKKIEFGVDVALDLPRKVVGDGIKLAQILGHITSNAIKFTPHNGAVNLGVSKVLEDDESVTILFEISDNGVGINEEKLKDILDRLQRIDSRRCSNFSKLGWGLTISHISIRLLGGELKIDTEEDKGSTFSFELTFKKDTTIKNNHLHLTNYENLKVGIVLPHVAVKREVDKILKNYMKHLNTECSFVYYDEIFIPKEDYRLPDILFVDHKYTKKLDEMKKILNIKSTIIFITSRSLKRTLEIEKYRHIHSTTKPITINKLTTILESSTNKMESDGEVKSILLYSEIKLQRSIYTTVFRKLGYNTQSAKDKDDFIDNITDYDYAVFDHRCFEEHSCSIVTLIRKLNTIPIILISEESVAIECAETIYNGTNSEAIQEKLTGAK